MLVVAPFVVIPLAYLLLLVSMSVLALLSPAPNQDAMVLAGLLMFVLIAAGLLSFLLGVVLYLDYRSNREA
jgi:hypothetical protein